MQIAAPQIIIDLVDRFTTHLDLYRAPAYNETQVRREFIDPMFKALGWDINNEKGYSEQWKEVIHEDAIKVGGFTKAPDYSFRLGGKRIFFLEAKKPSLNLKDDPAPAFQLRRYALTAKLPVSILTDFDEFVVYDTHIRPVITDKSSNGRILYIRYDEYNERWHEIAAIFSPEAIRKGAFDKYIQSTTHKRGTAEVDDAFLTEIEDWREHLARNIALRNPGLTQRELNFAVQRSIDRIIFLRICEDRGVEQYGCLQALLNGEDVYDRLRELFIRADERYNSGLFHFQDEKGRHEPPDKLTPHLIIDDKVLKDIFKRLYYPECPYEFSVLPAEILGQVYERFLGSVIRLTEGGHAKIEQKPEVRKAGGVYYTPAYIVDYIVKNTVGKLLEGKSPQEISGVTDKWQLSKKRQALTVLDPACGSGSFLLGAYQFLLDWYLERYIMNPEKWTKGKEPKLYQHFRGGWRLTTAERKRILLIHIYGLDIDSQAVEVTKLSLLLKVLEGESDESIQKQLMLFHKRALPDLADNIKCGNSLISPDFYRGRQGNLFDDEEMYRVNVFDWNDKKHGFGEIMTAGGFDVVIGNPPYIFTREKLTDDERNYFAERYKASWEKHNTYMLFMERMLFLIRNEGFASYIVPNSWLTIESAKLLRPLIIPRLAKILDLNYPAFDHVSMEPSIFVLGPFTGRVPVKVCRIQNVPKFIDHEYLPIDRSKWTAPDYRIVFSSTRSVSSLIDRIVLNSKRLGNVFDVRTGLQAYEKGKGSPPQSAEDVKNHVYDFNKKVDADTYRYLQGMDVSRYFINWSGAWMRHGPWLAQQRNLEIFSRPRVLVREITGRLPYCLHAMYVEGIYLNNKSILNILHQNNDKTKLKCLCAMLNSSMISLYYKDRAVKGARKIFPKIVIKNVREFPYPHNFTDNDEIRLASLVDNRMEMQLRLVKVSIPEDRAAIERQIDAMDSHIDRLVYSLYELTDDEIEMV